MGYIGVRNPQISTFDPNFLGYPSNPWKSLAIHFVKVGFTSFTIFSSKGYQHPKRNHHSLKWWLTSRDTWKNNSLPTCSIALEYPPTFKHKFSLQNVGKELYHTWMLNSFLRRCSFHISILNRFHPVFVHPSTKSKLANKNTQQEDVLFFGWNFERPSSSKCWDSLVGGWTDPFEKYVRQSGSSSPNRVENKLIWNHHPVHHVLASRVGFFPPPKRNVKSHVTPSSHPGFGSPRRSDLRCYIVEGSARLPGRQRVRMDPWSFFLAPGGGFLSGSKNWKWCEPRCVIFCVWVPKMQE